MIIENIMIFIFALIAIAGLGIILANKSWGLFLIGVGFSSMLLLIGGLKINEFVFGIMMVIGMVILIMGTYGLTYEKNIVFNKKVKKNKYDIMLAIGLIVVGVVLSTIGWINLV